jgi:hypothetical protein
MGNLYDIDVIAWAAEQAELLRSGRYSELDVANLVEEIEDVAKREKRELESRTAILIAHLLKWQLQPARRGRSWLTTIQNQRRHIERLIRRTPSLKHMLGDPDFLEDVWIEGCGIVLQETGLSDVPVAPVWPISSIFDPGFLP